MGNLPVVPPRASAIQLKAACALVSFKDRLDDAIQDSLFRDWVQNDLGLSVTNHAVDGDAFVAAVVPFTRCLSSRPSQSAMVPLERAVGASWRRGYGGVFLHEETSQNDEAFLLDPRRAVSSDGECARVTHFPPLGLFVAHEGKNRVRFLRDRGNLLYPALVADADYPSADRIRLYEVMVRGENAVWAVLDDRWVAALPCPTLSKLVLSPYGVPSPSVWPDAWPSPDTLALIKEETDKPGSGYPKRPGMDLKLAQEYEAEERSRFQEKEAWVEADHADLFGQLRPSRFGWAVLLLVALGLVCAMTIGVLPMWFKAGIVGAAISFFTFVLPWPRFWLARKALIDSSLHDRTRLRSLSSYANGQDAGALDSVAEKLS